MIVKNLIKIYSSLWWLFKLDTGSCLAKQCFSLSAHIQILAFPFVSWTIQRLWWTFPQFSADVWKKFIRCSSPLKNWLHFIVNSSKKTELRILRRRIKPDDQQDKPDGDEKKKNKSKRLNCYQDLLLFFENFNHVWSWHLFKLTEVAFILYHCQNSFKFVHLVDHHKVEDDKAQNQCEGEAESHS